MITRRIAICLFVCGATLLACAAASAQTSDWTFCASEGEVCAFTGTTEVRYGANGSYFYKTLSGGTTCTNSVFGDPAFGTIKSCAVKSEWTVCALEGGVCAFAGNTEVRYGANGLYLYRTLSDGTACSNSVFGDPAFGTAKQCELRMTNAASDWTFCASEGGTCDFTGTNEVRYGAGGAYFYKTMTDGSACSNSVFGDPAVGLRKRCETRLKDSSVTGYGPEPAITCPAGAVDVWPGMSIQFAVNSFTGTTTFCVRAGVHYLTSSITPKSGNTFVGEYGAILDGSGWTTTDTTEAGFRAHNQDIDYVTIRNLVIRNMSQSGVHAFSSMSDHWTIEYNEITSNVSGIVFPSYSTIRNNYIHHNYYGGYLGASSSHSTLDSNEIAYNGWEQKVAESANVTFRNNFVHHNAGDGIWYDTNNTNALIEGNLVEDNGEMGIFYETSGDVIIRNNTVRRNRDTGVFISTSKNALIYNNMLENNFRGITYFVNCHSVGHGTIGFDLANNWAHDNVIVVGSQSGALASVFSYTLCESAQLAPYQNGSMNLTFSYNTYDVPSPATVQQWFWNGLKYWNEWQALGQDLDSVAR